MKKKIPQIKKYKIDLKLKGLTKSDYDLAITQLPEILGVKLRQFKNYQHATLESNVNIPIDKMVVLAAFFKCSVEDLITDISLMRKKVEEKQHSTTEYSFLS